MNGGSQKHATIIDSASVYMGNLDPSTTSHELQCFLESKRYNVNRVDLKKKSKVCNATVHFETITDAKSAILLLNRTWFKGMKIHVKTWANNKRRLRVAAGVYERDAEDDCMKKIKADLPVHKQFVDTSSPIIDISDNNTGRQQEGAKGRIDFTKHGDDDDDDDDDDDTVQSSGFLESPNCVVDTSSCKIDDHHSESFDTDVFNGKPKCMVDEKPKSEVNILQTKHCIKSEFPIKNFDSCRKYNLVSCVDEGHSKPIYCVSWSNDLQVLNGDKCKLVKEEQVVQSFATCGGNIVTIYECINTRGSNVNSSSSIAAMNVRHIYVDKNEDERFYTCAWGGKSSGLETLDPFSTPNEKTSNTLNPDVIKNLCHGRDHQGPQLLCAAGAMGIVKVIDINRKMLSLTLTGHSDDIYEMKFSPVNEWLLITASKDESIRLWNLAKPCCISIFAGEKGHREAILTCDFHPDGIEFVSAGMDSVIRIWSMDSNEIRQRISNVQSAVTRKSGERIRISNECFPTFCTNRQEVHTNYVDCVRYVGHLILSKSIEHTIVLWKPNRDGPIVEHGISRSITALREFHVPNCELWFTRFDIYEDYKREKVVLACGNSLGLINLYDVFGTTGRSFDRKAFSTLSNKLHDSAVRMVQFSPDGYSFVAVTDDGLTLKYQLSLPREKVSGSVIRDVEP